MSTTLARSTPAAIVSTHERSPLVLSYQALRALAVCLVLANHFLPWRFPGGFIGVDIFFVISGFLITRHLLHQAGKGSVDLLSFYERRVKRLLPAALTVLSITALVVWFVFPPSRTMSTMIDILSSALYMVNWRLAFSSVDYFAHDPSTSPVNHFWSLAVEEQFYLIWPLVILLISKSGSKNGSPSLAMRLTMALVPIALVSFFAAIWSIHANKAAAYFYMHTRIWEFCVGGLAAIASLEFGSKLRWVWIGVLPAWLLLIASTWVLNSKSNIPGLDAFPVTLATAIILIAGDDHGLPWLDAGVRLPVVQWLGNISYSLYLWHWPIFLLIPLVFAYFGLHAPPVVLALVLTLGAADLSKRFIEDRFRQGKSAAAGSFSPPFGLSLAASVLVAAVALGAWANLKARSHDAAELLYRASIDPTPCFGAEAAGHEAACRNSHTLADRRYDLQTWSTQVHRPDWNWVNCQNEKGDSSLRPCSFGAAQGAARRHIALLGDSHAGMWIAALAELANRSQSRVDVFVASACSVTLDARSYSTYLSPTERAACLRWRKSAIDRIRNDPTVDTVVISGDASHQRRIAANEVRLEDDGSGFSALWNQLLASGKRVLVIDDVPPLPEEGDCLSPYRQKSDPCSYPAGRVPRSTVFSRAAARITDPNFSFASFRDVFCDPSVCHAVIGGIPAYMDSNHISAPFARSMAPRLAPYLEAAAGAAPPERRQVAVAAR